MRSFSELALQICCPTKSDIKCVHSHPHRPHSDWNASHHLTQACECEKVHRRGVQYLSACSPAEGRPFTWSSGCECQIYFKRLWLVLASDVGWAALGPAKINFGWSINPKHAWNQNTIWVWKLLQKPQNTLFKFKFINNSGSQQWGCIYPSSSPSCFSLFLTVSLM